MANETFIKGDAVLLSVWDDSLGIPAYEPIACLTSNSIDESVANEEVQTKCDPGNVVQTAGAYSYEISGDGLYIDEDVDTAKQSHAKLKAYLRAKTVLTWKMATGVTGTATEYGTGILTSVSLSANAGENANFTFTLLGRGAIVSVDPKI